jgi:catechol 2,3-dioxygenase-like lactoylglutathione lyase family enzyme
VSNIEKSIEFYQTILGLDTVLYDIKINENNLFQKSWTHKSATGKGAFNKLGNVTIELIQNLDQQAPKFTEIGISDCGFTLF